MAIAVSTIKRESAGSNTLIRASLTGVADTLTWASGIKEIVGYWANATDNPTQTDEAIDVQLSGSTFTFSVGAGTRTVDFCILAKI
jgi:hypothetical protein